MSTCKMKNCFARESKHFEAKSLVLGVLLVTSVSLTVMKSFIAVKPLSIPDVIEQNIQYIDRCSTVTQATSCKNE